ncbi:hypothetical protein G9F71_000785 [Clostridium sp. FP2]|uniref:hypothetical protein n=1 Tax=Clostridium sp. FP2 TaxID=2724481 RepID=UPI0013E90861|nr:hypothetical protein [Clostridium sp. FP2]MBZ9621427.1 hypothetical protein [Clostridium sp. FP2]
MDDLIIWCADIGSIKKNNFGWCRAELGERDSFSIGISIEDFAIGIAKDLSSGYKVALGFECPLFVPITCNPLFLTSARNGEGSRPWSAGAGCGALATGLTETVWILSRIKELTEIEINVTFSWDEFIGKNVNLFIWEAFVSQGSKATSHTGDAEVAVKTFINEGLNIVQANAVTAENPYNLVAAALLRAGISNDIGMLSQACIVIKA